MKLTEEFTELYGALLGDGCLSKYFANYDKRWRYCVQYTCHIQEKAYLLHLQSFVKKLFGISGNVRTRKTINVSLLDILSRRVFDYFLSFGFPVGKKCKLQIPEVFYSSQSLLNSCVRGIFDTDGSVYRRYSKKYSGHSKKFDYYNVEFHMNEEILLEQVKSILELQGIVCGKVRIKGNARVLCVHRQESVSMFFEIIVPSNQKHWLRWKNKI